MSALVVRFFTSLRSRPTNERRVLAVTTYLALASVFIAFWLVSVRETLLPAPAAPTADSRNQTSPPPPSSPETTKGRTLAELLTPFQALAEATRDATAALRDMTRGLNELARQTAENEPAVAAAPTTQREPVGAHSTPAPSVAHAPDAPALVPAPKTKTQLADALAPLDSPLSWQGEAATLIASLPFELLAQVQSSSITDTLRAYQAVIRDLF